MRSFILADRHLDTPSNIRPWSEMIRNNFFVTLRRLSDYILGTAKNGHGEESSNLSYLGAVFHIYIQYMIQGEGTRILAANTNALRSGLIVHLWPRRTHAMTTLWNLPGPSRRRRLCLENITSLYRSNVSFLRTIAPSKNTFTRP